MKKHLLIHTAFLLSALVSLVSCAEKLPTVDESLVAQLSGKWYVESGEMISLIGQSDSIALCQSLELVANGNMRETLYFSDGYMDPDSTFYGNWTIVDSTIVFNNWDGEPLDADCRILSCDQDRVTLSYNSGTTVLVSKDAMLRGVKEKLAGKWYSSYSLYSKSSSGWTFKESSSNYWQDLGYGGTSRDYKCSYDYATIVLDNSSYGDPVTCTIDFVTDYSARFRCNEGIYGVGYIVNLVRDPQSKYLWYHY